MNESGQASFESFPSEWVRGNFPALEQGWILMDNAGGSAPLARVIDRITAYMRHWPVQLGATYRLSAEAGELLRASRLTLAKMMACPGGPAPDAGELVLGSSTSSLLSRLARSVASDLKRDDEIVVTDVDHEANITPWRRLSGEGVRIRTWHLNQDSRRLEIEDLRPLLNERTRLVCFTHASNLLGEATPVEDITALVHSHGGQVCVDGVAYAPHRPLPVREWNVDYYVFSLYKVFGPHFALMYARSELLDGLRNINHDFMDGTTGAGKLELGGFPYELLYGAAGVPEYLLALAEQLGDRENIGSSWQAIAAHEADLCGHLLQFLDSRSEVEIIGPRHMSPARLPTVSFVVNGQRSSLIPPLCEPEKIGIRWGHFYAPRLVERLGLTGQDGVVRVSMAHYNTRDEVDALINTLDTVLDGLRT